MPALLAFDTATEGLHVGLRVGAHEWLHASAGAACASSHLVGRLRAILSDAGIGLRDLDAIAFGRGPGAFTGLRAACAVAQGLGLGASKPVLAIDTLMAVAEDARSRTGADDVWVAMDARMGEVYAARYIHVGGQWQVTIAPVLYTLEALNSSWQQRPPRAIAGSAVAAFGVRMQTGGAQAMPDAQPCARALLACASAGWERGSAADPGAALPLYLRDKVALTTVEREAAAAMRLAR